MVGTDNWMNLGMKKILGDCNKHLAEPILASICTYHSEAVVPHCVFQHLLAWANHLFHPCSVLVDLKCRHNHHILSHGNSCAPIHVHLLLEQKGKYKHKLNINLIERIGLMQLGSWTHLKKIERWVPSTKRIDKWAYLSTMLVRCGHEINNRNAWIGS